MEKDIYLDFLKSISSKDINEIYKIFNSSENGLKNSQININNKKYGKNIINFSKKLLILDCLKKSFFNFFNLLLFFIAIISYFIDGKNFTENKMMSFFMIIFLLLGGGIRFFQELKSNLRAKNLFSKIESEIFVRREGKILKIQSKDLLVGDIVILSVGDKVCGDIRLIKNKVLVSQSAITGESKIINKTSDKLFSKNSTYSNLDNIIYAGSNILSGNGEGIILSVGENTLYGKLLKILQLPKKDYNKTFDSFIFTLIKFIIIFILISFLINGLLKKEWLNSFILGISIAIGLTPEFFPIVINACLTKGSIQMEKKATIIKNINALEKFGSMDILCVDKTGTLTKDEISLEYYMDILGNESKEVLDFAFLNSYYSENKNYLDKSILKLLEIPSQKKYFKTLIDSNKKIDEISFDYTRKFTTVIVKNNNEKYILVKGNVKNIFKKCGYIKYKNTIKKIDNEKDEENIYSVIDEVLEDGMKVLAVAYKKIDENFSIEDEKDLILVGYLVFFNPPKESASLSIENLKKLNINIKVLTGDQEKTTYSICKRLNIKPLNLISGLELSKLNKESLKNVIEKYNIFTDLTPNQKTEIIDILHSQKHTVGFLGDGLNDLGALKNSSVGISVDSAVEEVKNISDVILLKNDLNILEQGILEGRKAFININKYIKITFSSNFGNIFSMVIASIFLPFQPLTAVQFLLLNLIYDLLCFTLPWDNIDEDVSFFPQKISSKNLESFMIYFGIISSVFDIVTFLFLYYFLCPKICGDLFINLSNDLQDKFIGLFHTGWFLVSLWTQTLIIQLLKSKNISKNSKFSFGILILNIIGLIIFSCFVYSPIVEYIGFTSLPIWYFIFLSFIIISYIFVVNKFKIFYIKKYNGLYN